MDKRGLFAALLAYAVDLHSPGPDFWLLWVDTLLQQRSVYFLQARPPTYCWLPVAFATGLT